MTATPALFVATGIFHPEPGGPATYLHEILPHLKTLGWDLRLLTFGDAPTAGYPYPVRRIPRRPLPVRLAHYALAARPLLAWADVVYVQGTDLPLIGSRRAPRIMKIVGDPAWERAIRKGWVPPSTGVDAFQTGDYGAFVRRTRDDRSRQVRAAAAVIVPGEYLRRMVIGWGVDPDRVQVIYNAMPPESPAADLSREDARARLGLDPGPTVLTAARLTAWKGVDHLIAALPLVPDARLLVAGDGPELNRLKALAAPLGDRVRFLGQVPREQMPLYMRAADCFALYSGYEGLSHALLESLRAGTPVIASDRGGNPEVVAHGVNGLLVPYVDLDALAAALRDALDPTRRDALAAHSAHGMDRFAFDTMLARTDAALRAFL